MANTDDEEEPTLPAHIGKATLPASIEKGRFPNEKKSTHLVEAEKTVLAKNSPKALYQLACKPLQQEARIRSTKEVSDMVSTKLYLYKRSHTNLYRTCTEIMIKASCAFRTHECKNAGSTRCWIMFELA